MGKDAQGTKRGRCVACGECEEYEQQAEDDTCQCCAHNRKCHVKVVTLGLCKCGHCHGYSSKNEFQYFQCDYCACDAEKHVGWERVHVEYERVKTLVKEENLIQLDSPTFAESEKQFQFTGNPVDMSIDKITSAERSCLFEIAPSCELSHSLSCQSMPNLLQVDKNRNSLPASGLPSLLNIPIENKYLDDLREKIEIVKLELKKKYEKLHHLLSLSEMEKFRDLDIIYEHYEKLFADRIININELEIAKNTVFDSLNQSDLKPAYAKIISTLETEKKAYQNFTVDVPDLIVHWDELSFQDSLQNICHIIEVKSPGKFFKMKPNWHQSKRGNGPEDLNHAKGIAVDNETQNLYIADCLNDRIQVYDENGIFLETFCQKKVLLPRRICISGQFLFITSGLHQLNKINKYTGEIIGKTEFEFSLSGIDSKGNKYLYVCDLLNLQIVVVRISNLKFKRKFTLKATNNSDTQTRDIRVEATAIYVLFHKSQFPLQSFTHEGVLIRHIVTETMVLDAKYFCLDASSNILISDSGSHQIRVFSPQGDLVQVVGRKGKENPGDLFEPQGIAVNYAGSIYVVDMKVEANLQAF
ncbi:NHL repeat containing protein [Oopsacas minuta]|uniref:NHL repeat containing protein n=1 Tax=Oopsacas minuta TaxID=111878 RepID=A0AAV7JFT1_9METZ|nr:NHL repeat containing protein [Oopsacas minuta]